MMISLSRMFENKEKKVFKSYCLPMLTFVLVFTRKNGNRANALPQQENNALCLTASAKGGRQ